jgi:hypothetical protein
LSSKLGVATATLAAAASLLSPSDANAVLEPNGANDQLYRDLGAQYQGAALQMRILVPGVGVGFRNASATFLNSNFAITATHTFYDLLQYNPTFEFGDGLNYLTDRGNLMHATSFWIYPGSTGSNGASVPDITLIKFDSPYFASSDKTIGSVGANQTVTSAGFGDWGTPNSVAANGLARDGQLRGWEANVSPIAFGGYSDTYYQSAYFGFGNSGLLDGQGANRDSGSPVFNNAGELVGINVAADLSYGQLGATEFLGLSNPDVQSWVYSIVPEPSSGALALLGGSALLASRRKRA